MAGSDRAPSSHLITTLLARAPHASFYQLVFLLEQLYQPKTAVGTAGSARDEVLRFRPDLSFAFPVSDVAALEQPRTTPPQFRLTTTFLGLYGTTSPLPPFYTEDLIARDDRDDPVRAFLDIFHHRLLSLLYRSWVKYRYPVQFQASGADQFSQRLFAFLGLGTEAFTNTTTLPSSRLLRYAGLLNQRPRSAAALEGLLSDVFDEIQVRIEQCTGQWVPIPPSQRAELGRPSCILEKQRQSSDTILGQQCALGEQIFGRQTSFRITLGPMNHESFLNLSPGRDGIRLLSALVQFFAQDRFDVDLELILDGDEVPVLRLTSQENDASCRLGNNTWLPSRSDEVHSHRVSFRLRLHDVSAASHGSATREGETYAYSR